MSNQKNGASQLEVTRKVVAESFLDGVKNLLGESPMQAVFFHLQLVNYVEDIGKFDRNLRTIFGEQAVVIERAIAKELFQKVGIPYDGDQPFDFERSINLAVKILSSRLKEAEA